MNELKSVYIDRTGDWCRSVNDTGTFYLKSEADEVIAELNRKIKLYEDFGSCKKGCFALRHNQRRIESEIYRVKLKEKEILHHKYKRCLAMAKYCHESAMWFEEYGITKSATFMLRWHKRWLKLAEQFKEAK